ncbi:MULTISPECIES: hypothetical protein [unclassified Corynebacterium]|uniref:hypothetical protein n=1 Tax=unclassified Corynebacterium TaxID=2624378 RepID=UPI0029C9D006|nr:MULTISPECIES: hypothetical protein [unclassified Corynebacterium]WPF66637.1 hypothetical protein OLX12_02575 [Corynebacterium sp. 22KM0430]WPF69125.1 hypothetical protein OLW90_02570 [Corynebacterium sp. 21KM1197]
MTTPSAETMRFTRVAYEGAQVRTAAQLVSVPDLLGARPRSVVVLATDTIAQASARLLVALREPLRVPVVIVHELPGYLGALDTLVVVGSRPEDERAARAMSVATQRGATVIYAGPAEGPLRTEAPERAVLLDAPQAAPALSPARTIAALSAVLDLTEDDPRLVASRMEHLADTMDEEIARVHPDRDESVNPARNLRSWVEGARVMHTGYGAVPLALAEVVARSWSAYEIPGGVAEPQDVAGAVAQRDLFFDPLLDGEGEMLPLKVVVWAAEEAHFPGGLAQSAPAVAHGPVAEALCLIVRALAATVPLGAA